VGPAFFKRSKLTAAVTTTLFKWSARPLSPPPYSASGSLPHTFSSASFSLGKAVSVLEWSKPRIASNFFYNTPMARRSKSSQSPIWIIVIIFVAIIAFGGAALLFQQTAEPFRTAESLDVNTYLENARSIRGNIYRAEGNVDNALA